MITLKKFLKIVFSAPDPKKSIFWIFGLGLIYGFITYLMIGNSLSLNNLHVFLGFSILVYILPALVYGSLAHTFIKNFYKRRAYLLAGINEFLLFLGFLSITFVSAPTDLVNLMWWWIALIYSIDVLAILGSFGKNGKLVSVVYSLLYPGIIGVILYFFYDLYLYGPESLIMIRSIGLVTLGASIVFLIYLMDYFFSLNVSEISTLDLFSAFLNKEPLNLKNGVEINSLLQVLKIKNGEELNIAAPWLHPGPLRTLGGGHLSHQIINGLNNGKKGFFWHVPSCHEQDPSDSSVTEILLDKSEENPAEFFSKGTRLLSVEDGEYKIYGQKIGEFYLVLLELEGEDDYEISIFRNLSKRLGKKILFVDSHNHIPPENEDVIMLAESKEAEKLEDLVEKLIEKLDEEEQKEIRAGGDVVNKEVNFMNLVLEVGGQRNAFVTLDSNGLSSEMRENLEKISDKFDLDNTILLTTDAHKEADILSLEDKLDLEELEESLKKALEGLKPSEIGLLERKIENVRVLGKDYHTIKSSVNLITHLFPILLLALYISVLIILFAV